VAAPQFEINEFCEKFTAWARLLSKQDERFAQAWQIVSIAIDHSNLLWRLFYAEESIRKNPCSVHKGHWSGCGPDPGCGCWSYGNITGWVAEAPENPEAHAPYIHCPRG